MPLLQMLATVQEEQSLGHLQELTSPVLGKLKEALIFTRLANAQRRAFGSRTVVLEGRHGPSAADFVICRILCLLQLKNRTCRQVWRPAPHRMVRRSTPVGNGL